MQIGGHRYQPARYLLTGGFTLVELLVVVSLITVLAFFTAPVVHGLSKVSRRHSSVTKLSRTFEQARSYALASGMPSRVAFCDVQDVASKYRMRAYAIFQQDPQLEKTLIQGQWHVLDEGCLFRAEKDDLLGSSRTRDHFEFAPESRMLLLPYIEFDELGRVLEPKQSDYCSIEVVDGFMEGGSARITGESSSHRLSIVRSTGRVRISEVVDSLP